MTESAKPLIVDGVKIAPRWPWSDAYRSEVRQALTADTPYDCARREDAELEYIRQWAQRRGLPCETEDDMQAVRDRIRAEQVPA